MKAFACVLAIVVSLNCFAQAPAFEVASVRLHDGPATANPALTADSLTLRGSTLQSCIQIAWQLPEARVIGPEWMKEVRLDIAAKTALPVDSKQIFLMLRTLLTERLGVLAHMESRETPVYALTLGKGGPKFSASATEGEITANKKNGITSVEHVTMADFARVVLSQGFDRPFVDATGLTGRYDIHLDMKPYLAVAAADGNQGSQMDNIGILMTAMSEQLGLKVEARKEKIEVLLVDHAEKTPTEN